MSVNYTEWFIMLKKNENRRKKNVWFHSQTNLNLHYKEKGFAGLESIDCTKQCTKVTKGKCHHLSQDKIRTSYLLIKNYTFPDFFLSHKFSLTQSEISWLLPVYENISYSRALSRPVTTMPKIPQERLNMSSTKQHTSVSERFLLGRVSSTGSRGSIKVVVRELWSIK